MKRSRMYRKGNVRSHILPVIVWLIAFAAILVMFKNRTTKFEAVGIVEGEERRIAATIPGRVKTINFDLYDKVKPGDIIVVVDTVLDRKNLELQLNAQRNLILAEITQLKAELDATRDKMLADEAERKDDINQTTRRYYVDLEDAKLKIVEFKVQIEPAKIKQRELELDLKIKDLALASPDSSPQERMVFTYELEKLKAEQQILAKEIEENEKLLLQAQENRKLAEKRLQEILNDANNIINPSIALALKPIEEKINVQYKAIEQLNVQRPELEIRSPFKGIVSNIRRSAGEIILERESILTLVEYEPHQIVAYVSEDLIGHVAPNMKVEILKRSYPQKVASSVIKQIGPVMELLPERLWPNTTLPRWGQPIIIPIPYGMQDLLPGEIVAIRGI